METVSFFLNDQELEVPKGTSILDASLEHGVQIPHYCYHPGLTVVASCRMCHVECHPPGRLVPACATPISDGMKVYTETEMVKESQRGVLEFLLINHPLDCPICDQAGECFLQDYSYDYGGSESRFIEEKITQGKKDVGPDIVLFTDRCILCSLCVRFCQEVSGTSELTIVNRGAHSEIEIFPGKPVDNPLAGNVVDICPVGALCDKDFLYKMRVWFLNQTPTVCPGCSRGCNITVDSNDDVIYRIKPRKNPEVNRWWICDAGRHGFKFVNDENRMLDPWIHRETGREMVGVDQAVDAIARRLRQVVEEHGPGSVAALISPHCTNEENYFLCDLMVRGIGTSLVASTDSYPKGDRQEFPGGFVIDADKAANVAGARDILATFGTELADAQTVRGKIELGDVKFLYILSSDPFGYVRPGLAEAAGRAKFVVVHDLFKTPLAETADVFLPGGTFAEKDGTFTNSQGRIQRIQKAVSWLGEGTTEFGVLLQIARRLGLEIPYQTPDEALRAIASRDPEYAEVPPPTVPLLAIHER